MKRIKDNPISSVLGLVLFFGAAYRLLIETNNEIPFYVLFMTMAGGVLLLFAKDKLLDILTLGLSGLIQDRIDKKNN